MKRTLILVLALLLVLSCTSFASAEETKHLSVATVPAGASFPNGVSIGNSDYLLKIEELTGFDLEWTTLNDSSSNGIRMLLSSGNAPDLIQVADVTMIPELAKQGAVAPLTQALDTVGADLKALLPEEVLASCMINGEIYFLPRYTGGIHLGTMGIRKDVLDQLSLEIPVTIEDWENVLATVKEKTDLLPLTFNGALYSFTNFAHAYGANFNRTTFFSVQDGTCYIPMLSEKGLAFITKMHEWYEAGYIDREFLIDDGSTANFFAGNGFAKYIEYTDVARLVPAFYEKNPDAELLLIDPPVGENGEFGYTVDTVTAMGWFVPATSADKVELAIELLNASLNPDVLNLICYGFEGVNWEYVDGVPTFIKGNPPADYRGYYSRMVLDMTWDTAWEASMGLEETVAQVEKYKKLDDILYLPYEGLDAYYENNGYIFGYINDEVIRMIVEGTSEEEVADLYNEILESYGGQKIIDEVNAWLASR